MAVRFTHTFYNSLNQKYVVHIHDSAFSSTPTAIELCADGFTLTYDGDGDPRFELIKASSLSLPVLVTNSTVQAFIDELPTAKEDRFSIVVYQGDTPTLFWLGTLLPDTIEYPDLGLPYQIDIRFSDGIALLKDIPFDDDGTLYNGRDTFIQMLVKVFSHTNTHVFFDSDDPYIKTKVTIRNTNMGSVAANKCPLAYADIDHMSFQTADKDTGQYTALKCYDVLHMICQAWQLRLYMQDGAWFFTQVNEAANSGYVRTFSKAGTYLSNATQTLTVTSSNFTRVQGMFSYAPGLLNITKVYKHKCWVTANLLPVQDLYETALGVGYVEQDSSVNDAYKVTGGVNMVVTNTIQAGLTLRAVFGLEIIIENSVGTKYYFTGVENSTSSWSTTAGYYKITKQFSNSVPVSTVQHWFEVYTPQFPVDGDATFRFYHIGYEQYVTGYWGIFTATGYVSMVYNCYNFLLKIMNITDLELQSNSTTKYKLEQVDSTYSEPIKLSSVEELDESYIGTNFNQYDTGRIKVSSDGVTWNFYLSGWTDGTYIDQPFHVLTMYSYLIGQRTALKRYRGSIRGLNIKANYCYQIDSNYYFVNSLEFTASGSMFTCELIQIKFEPVIANINLNLTQEENVTEQTGGSSSGGGAIGDGMNIGKDTEINYKLGAFLSAMAIARTAEALVASTEYSSFDVERIPNAVLLNNDPVLLVDPTTFATHEMTLAADQAADAESLTVDATTPSSTFPEGSLVLVRPYDLLRYLRA